MGYSVYVWEADLKYIGGDNEEAVNTAREVVGTWCEQDGRISVKDIQRVLGFENYCKDSWEDAAPYLDGWVVFCDAVDDKAVWKLVFHDGKMTEYDAMFVFGDDSCLNGGTFERGAIDLNKLIKDSTVKESYTAVTGSDMDALDAQSWYYIMNDIANVVCDDIFNDDALISRATAKVCIDGGLAGKWGVEARQAAIDELTENGYEIVDADWNFAPYGCNGIVAKEPTGRYVFLVLRLGVGDGWGKERIDVAKGLYFLNAAKWLGKEQADILDKAAYGWVDMIFTDAPGVVGEYDFDCFEE